MQLLAHGCGARRARNNLYCCCTLVKNWRGLPRIEYCSVRVSGVLETPAAPTAASVRTTCCCSWLTAQVVDRVHEVLFQ